MVNCSLSHEATTIFCVVDESDFLFSRDNCPPESKLLISIFPFLCICSSSLVESICFGLLFLFFFQQAAERELGSWGAASAAYSSFHVAPKQQPQPLTSATTNAASLAALSSSAAADAEPMDLDYKALPPGQKGSIGTLLL
jgi:hypothetical protein